MTKRDKQLVAAQWLDLHHQGDRTLKKYEYYIKWIHTREQVDWVRSMKEENSIVDVCYNVLVSEFVNVDMQN